MAALASLPNPLFNWSPPNSIPDDQNYLPLPHSARSDPPSSSSAIHPPRLSIPLSHKHSAASNLSPSLASPPSARNQLLHGLNLRSNRPSHPGLLWEEALKEPIQFTSGQKSSATNQVPYEPINKAILPGQGRGVLISAMAPLPPKTCFPQDDGLHSAPSSRSSREDSPRSSRSTQQSSIPPSRSSTAPLSSHIVTSWIRPQPVGPGFYNTGNTCFLNATLQALVHTPALTIGLMDREEHCPESCCLFQTNKFCGLCRMHSLLTMCFETGARAHAIVPSPFSRNLSKFAPSMRGGRQEDAHEFLRLLIEAMQDGALGGRADKAKLSQKESTFVHRMFGGKLRSRVVCEYCRTASDTYDNFLDLSLDISHDNSVPAALRAYRKTDTLSGANQYKCEKCKCLRDAKKVMSVFSAPPILTLHLKRFNFRGRKITKRVNFDNLLDLRPAMSEGSGPTGYKLYAVVCHQGHSNKNGHYYAHIKGSNGQWYLADDSTVQPLPDVRRVLENEHAYMLFYARDREDVLAAAIGGHRHQASSLSQAKSAKRKSVGADRCFPVEDAEGSESESLSQLNGTYKKPKMRETTPGQLVNKNLIGPRLPVGRVSGQGASVSHRMLDELEQGCPSAYQPSASTTEYGQNPFKLAPSRPNYNETSSSFEKPQGSNGSSSRKRKARHRRLVNINSTQVPTVSTMQPRIIRG